MSNARLPHLLTLFSILYFSAAAVGQEIETGTAWHESSVTLLDVDFPDTGFHANWEYFHCECGDVLIRLEQSAPDSVLTGELLLVERKAILARGQVAEGADLELMAQSPILMLQLSFALLQRAIPAGPGKVSIDADIDLEETDRPLQLHTALTFGQFEPPWSVKGRVWRAGQERRRFELDFEFAVPQPDNSRTRSRIRFVGGQDFARSGFPLTGIMPLDGWKIQRFSMGETQPSDAPAGRTLDDLRAELRNSAQP